MATPTNVNTTIAAGDALRVGVTSSPPPPPPAPAQSITLTALSGLSATAGGGGLNFSAQVANPTALPLNFVLETVSGPTASPTPSSSTWSLGDLNKAISAAWAAAGTSVIRVRDANNATSNSLSVSVAAAPTPPPPAPSPATTATLSLSPTGTTGSPTTGTVTLNGPSPASGSITISGSGATITPSTLSWSSGEAGTAKSFTVQRATDGTTSVSITSGIAGVTVAGSPVSHTTSAAVVGTPSPFTLTSATSGTLPFTVGHAFRQGDIPAGQGVVITNATAQVTPKNYWPDGSLKFAIIAGSYTSAGSAVTVTPSAGTASTGTALTTADLIATGITAEFGTGGTFGIAAFGNTEWAAPFQSWVSGHRMSSWIFRKQIGSDAHLVAWLEVRLFAGGAVEVLPWVENGYVNVASPTNKSATYTFTLGGTSRFSAAIDLKHHQRTPLLSGAALSYWLATDPGVTPLHNAAYLMATELVPTYSAVVPAGNARVTAQPTTFTPLQQGSFDYSSDAMTSSGYQRPIGLLPEHDVLHLVANAADRATTYASVVRNGYSAGRYGIHYRDENTNRPLRFSDHPTRVIADSAGFASNGSSTTSTRTPTPTGGNPPVWDTAHSPSVGYMAYLLTGRWYFMEEVLFAATCNYLGNGDNNLLRTGSQGLVQTAVDGWQTRASAWDWRTHAQALAVVPDDDTALRAELINRANSNIDFFHAMYVAQANNPFGMILPGEQYSGSISLLAIWQQDMVTAAWGYSRALGLPLDATRTSRLAAFFDWKAQSVVGRLGTIDGFPAENANRYQLQLGTSLGQNSYKLGTGPWPASWAAIYSSTAPLAVSPDNPLQSPGSNFLATEFDASSAAKGNWGTLQPAISYAARWGVPGALAAYARMVGAFNFPTMLEANWSTNFPVMSVVPASGFLPAWRQGMAVGQIKNLSTASNTQGAALNAWGTTVLIDGSGTLVSPANGGHTDSFDNRVTSIDLLADAPAWTVRIAPTPFESVVSNADYYADGKPNSRHGYTHSHYIGQIGRVVLFGAEGTYQSGGASYTVDGVRVSDWTWDAAGTYPSLAAGRGYGQGRDPLTGNTWTNGGWLWNRASNTWSQPGTQQFSGNTRSPWAYDSKAGNFYQLLWRDGRNLSGTGVKSDTFSVITGVRTPITINASAAYTQFQADNPAYAALTYDTVLDCFYFYCGQTYDTNSVTLSQVPTRIYKITKGVGTTWDMSLMTVTGDTPANVTGAIAAGGPGINGRFVYVPALRGVFCQPAAGVAPWFLRTS